MGLLAKGEQSIPDRSEPNKSVRGHIVNLPPSHDQRIEEAKNAILNLFQTQALTVAYDRELRYRLEGSFPHDQVGEALRQLKDEGSLKQTNVPGRRGTGEHPNVFYRLPNSNYNDLLPIMKTKLDLSIFIGSVGREMGRYAELAWWRAFERNGWAVYPASENELQGVSEYKGRKATTGHNIEFVAEKDGIEYGVEVKNRLPYPDDLYWKLLVCVDLQVVPLIIARWLNPGQPRIIEALGGAKPFVYKSAIYAKTYEPIVDKVKSILGYPIDAREDVDDAYFQPRIQAIHESFIRNKTNKYSRLKRFHRAVKVNPNWKLTLGVATD